MARRREDRRGRGVGESSLSAARRRSSTSKTQCLRDLSPKRARDQRKPWWSRCERPRPDSFSLTARVRGGAGREWPLAPRAGRRHEQHRPRALAWPAATRRRPIGDRGHSVGHASDADHVAAALDAVNRGGIHSETLPRAHGKLAPKRSPRQFGPTLSGATLARGKAPPAALRRSFLSSRRQPYIATRPSLGASTRAARDSHEPRRCPIGPSS